MAKKTTGDNQAYAQLKSDLKTGGLRRFYVLYGEEDYLRRDALARIKKRLLDELTECIAAPVGVEEQVDAKELGKTIRSFLDTLPVREQDIFLRRYFFVEESGTIAKRYGMKPATVLRTLSRTRMKLKKYLTREGYAV